MKALVLAALIALLSSGSQASFLDQGLIFDAANNALFDIYNAAGVERGTSTNPFFTNIADTSTSNTITAVDTGTTSLVGANGQVFYTGNPTAGSMASFSIASIQMVSVQANILGGGGTLVVEVSQDGGTFWFRPDVCQTATQSCTNSFTAPFQSFTNVTAMSNIRVRAITSWSGTATILVRESINARSITVNAGVNLNTSLLATDAHLNSLISANHTDLTSSQPRACTLQAGGAIAGKFGIDQTTPGTTNLVAIGTNGIVGVSGGGSSLTVKAGSVQPAISDTAVVVTERPDNVGTPTQTSVSCASTSTTLLAASTATMFLSIRNPTTSTVTIWINEAGAAAVVGVPSHDIPPGGEADYFAEGPSFLPTSQINCISSGAASSVALFYK